MNDPKIGATDWVGSKLSAHDEVIAAAKLSDYGIRIRRKNNPECTVAAIKSKNVSVEMLKFVLSAVPECQFIANTPNDHFVDTDVYAFCEGADVGYGGLALLFRALNDTDPRYSTASDVGFILKGLRQHSAVSQVTRTDHSRYLVRRANMPNISMIVTNAYDVTADVLRSTVARFGKADIILCSNPNHRMSTEASAAAARSNWRVTTWAELYGALNKPGL